MARRRASQIYIRIVRWRTRWRTAANRRGLSTPLQSPWGVVRKR